MRFNDFIIKARERLDVYSDLLPVLCLIGSGVLLAVYGFNINAEWFPSFDWFMRSFVDCSAICLLLMFCKSKNYGLVSWIAYGCLCLLWLLNMVYVSFDFEADAYFMLFVLAIYAIFVIAVIAKITNRC